MLTKKEKVSWVAALRSGKYNQARECLKRIDSAGTEYHCCLGVLCDVLDDTKSWYSADFNTNVFDTSDGDSHYYNEQFDSNIMKKIDGEDCLSGGIVNTLMNLNDKGSSFEEIADYIEENVPVANES